jgi:hypothetical protein
VALGGGGVANVANSHSVRALIGAGEYGEHGVNLLIGQVVNLNGIGKAEWVAGGHISLPIMTSRANAKTAGIAARIAMTFDSVRVFLMPRL